MFGRWSYVRMRSGGGLGMGFHGPAEFGRRRQTVCKPGSVLGPRADGWPFLWDARCRTPRATNPDGGRKLPSRPPGFPWHRVRPYSVLLPVGFTLPRPLPAARCALTAPFHPCPRAVAGGTGGLLSVALSLGSPPPGVTRHRVPVEPGLSSPGAEAPRAAIRPSGGPEGRRGVAGPQGIASGQPICGQRMSFHECGPVRTGIADVPEGPSGYQFNIN